MSRILAAPAAAPAAAEPTTSRPVRQPTRSRAGQRKKARINDLDLKNWKQYDEILTDSLWIVDERDSSGAHKGDYHGNFIPQIPNQMMLRYTKVGDAVLDPFAGSGTTLIEARRLGRNALGIELQPHIAEMGRGRIAEEPDPHGSSIKIINEDSRSSRAKIRALNYLKDLGKERFQCAILHPPYHDIIQFSDSPSDLSNAGSVDNFLNMFDEIVANSVDLLEKGRYLALVIGDKYDGGEWIPLSFFTMQRVLAKGMTLKSIVVKNMAGNRAKRNVENLWRYRALNGGFYIFRHEYVFLFKKS